MKTAIRLDDISVRHDDFSKIEAIIGIGAFKAHANILFITFNNHVTGSNSDTVEHALVMLISAHDSHPFYRFT